MEITDIRVHGFDWACKASGLPMSISGTQLMAEPIGKPDLSRMNRLAMTDIGTGHDNFLSGITVNMNIKATVKWWQQFQRYHFAQIVSSQSTMHRLKEMLLNESASFNYNVDRRVIELLYQIAKETDDIEVLAYSCPMGLEMMAAVTTNYRQLKTIYAQRKNHKLEEWREFCQIMVDMLPCSHLFTGEAKTK